MGTAGPSNKDSIADAFRTFSFSTDQEYQTGLQGILASDTFKDKSDEEKENTLRMSRVFYFNKVTGNSITPGDALNFESPVDSDNLAEQQHRQAAGDGARTLTFIELKALIEQGKTDSVPNNRLIPNILNDAPPSENTTHIRKKPWEM